MALSQRLVIRAEETISGFNYAFMKALLTKAQKLDVEGRLYEKYSSSDHGILAQISSAVLNNLCIQMGEEGRYTVGSVVQLAEISSIIEAASEFLAIFKARD